MVSKMNPITMQRVREARRITRAELARRAGMQANMIAWIETGRFFPYPSQLEKIARVLGVSDPESLLEELEVEDDALAAV